MIGLLVRTRGGFLFCGLSAIRLRRAAIASCLGISFGSSFASSHGSSLGASHLKRGFLDDLAQRVQMVEGFFGGRVAEDYGELFASAAERLAVASDLR